MKTIQLTKGKVALVDDDDYERLAQVPWYTQKTNGGVWYAMRRARGQHRRQKVQMHRVVLGLQDLETGQQLSKLMCDHINRDGLDNRRSNLRSATPRQQSLNCRGWGRSGFRGVYLRSSGRYQVLLRRQGHLYALGTYDTPEEASHAYQEALDPEDVPFWIPQ